MCSTSHPANNASASATRYPAVDELRGSSTNYVPSVLSCTPGEGALKTKLRKQDTQTSARMLGFDRAQLSCVWAALTLIHAIAFGVSVSGSPRASSAFHQVCAYGEAAWDQPSSDEAPLPALARLRARIISTARARLRARISVYLAGVGIGLISLAGFGQSYEAPNGVPAPGTRCGNSWEQAGRNVRFEQAVWNATVVAKRGGLAAVVAWYGAGTHHLQWGWLYALTTYLALWTSFTSILPPASALVSHEDVDIQRRRSAYPELGSGYRRCCRIVNGELVKPYSKSFMWKVSLNTSMLFCMVLYSLCSAYIEVTLLHSSARSALRTRTLNSHSSTPLFPPLSAHFLERDRGDLAALRASRFDEVAGGPRRTWWVHNDQPHHLCPPRYHTCDSMAIWVGLRRNRWRCPRGSLRHRLPGAFVQWLTTCNCD